MLRGGDVVDIEGVVVYDGRFGVGLGEWCKAWLRGLRGETDRLEGWTLSREPLLLETDWRHDSIRSDVG